MRKIFFVITMLFIFNLGVKANTCDTKEVSRLIELANRVRINYDVGKIWVENFAAHESVMDKVEVDNFYLTIYNLTEDLFVIITNNKNDDETVVIYEDLKDGKYSLDTRDNLFEITEYTFRVYAKNDPCKMRELRTIKYTKPITNQLYFFETCQKNLDVPVCQQYITKKLNINFSELDEYIENYKKNNIGVVTTKKVNNEKSFIDKYKYYILGLGVVVFGSLTFFVIKKRRNL